MKILNRKSWVLIFWANLLFICLFWWNGSGSLLAIDTNNALIAVGRLTGLLGAYALLLQFFFTGRSPFLEGVFGLDKLAKIHQISGKYFFILIILHAVFLVLGYAGLAHISLWAQFLDFFNNYEDVGKAVFGVGLLLVVVATSIYIVRSKLKYETWFFVHLLAYLVVLLTFGHQFTVGSDFAISKIFYGYWFALYVFVFGSQLVFRFLKPLYSFWKHGFKVEKIQKEAGEVISIYITGKNIEQFKVEPGQFMIFRFLDKKRFWQAHPFSLSEGGRGGHIRITPKQLGDFTNELSSLEVGTSVIIDGPYGVFTKQAATKNKVLLIAGGIGITPMRALIEAFQKEKKDVVLLYGNRMSNELVFKTELEELEKNGGLKIHTVMSGEPEFPGEKGYIDEEKITRLTPDYKERDIYICGPPVMMDKLIELFKKREVPAEQIHFEKFSLH